jgi:hypothetical protein
MGKRDYAHREKKKTKKDPKKIAPVTVISAPVEVEVIKKGKKKHEEEEE